MTIARHGTLLVLLGVSACTSDDPSKTDPTSRDSGALDVGVPDECDDAANATICVDGVAVECDGLGDVLTRNDCADSATVCVDNSGCEECGVSLVVHHAANTDASAFVAVRPQVTDDNREWETFHARPVTIQSLNPAITDGALEWTLLGDGFTLIDNEGGSAPASASVTTGVHAHQRGEALFSARHTACPELSSAVGFHSDVQPPFSARIRPSAPWVERAETFNQEDDIHTVLHSGRHTDRRGLRYDVYVVNSKTASEWVDDQTLTDVTASGRNQARLATGGSKENRTLVSDEPLAIGPTQTAGFDVVYDFDLNGRLDPGDLIMGGDEPGFTVMGDLHVAGPHETEEFQHSGGTWYTQKVYYPADIEAMAPTPLVVISHGNGHSYLWYDYLGRHLASYGYVVMSHTNLTGPGIETASTTTLVNTDFFLAMLDDLEDGVLAGRVDDQRIAWIGHSRGGEGVVRAYDRMVDEYYTNDHYSAEDIVLVSSIAPTMFYSVEYSDPHDVPYHLFAGAADGDVHGSPASTGVQYFRLTSAAESVTQTTYLQGVGHNEFNCCGFDDATGPAQLGRSATQDIAKAYYLALVRAYASGHSPSLDYFRRSADGFRPQGLTADAVIANEYRPDPTGSWAIDSFQDEPDPTIASSGASVSLDVDAAVEDWLADGNGNLTDRDSDPMNGMTQACCAGDENRGMVFEWYNENASIAWELPVEDRDISAFSWLSVRVAQGTRHDITNELDAPLDFSISLIDEMGERATVGFGPQGRITQPYQRSGNGSGAGWSNEFSTVRVRLSDFYDTNGLIDPTLVATVQFDFGSDYGSPMGRIGIDDVLLEY